MKIEKIIYPFAVMVSAACLTWSCNHLEVDAPSNLISVKIDRVSDDVSPETRSSEPLLQQRLADDLWLTVTISDNPVINDSFQTKGELTTSDSFISKYQSDGFGVYAEYPLDPSVVILDNVNFIWDSSSSLWTPNIYPKVTWPGYATDWYCWAPRDVTTLLQDYKMISYSTPIDNTSNDKDILVAKAQVPRNYNNTLNITFKHALCAVRFVATDGLPTGTIDSLAISNIYLDGNYDFDTDAWQDLSNPGSISLKNANNSVSPGSSINITNNTQTFFVIPQTVNSLSTAFCIKHNDVKHTFKLPAGFKFPAEKFITVNLSYEQPLDGHIHLDDPGDGGSHNMYWY